MFVIHHDKSTGPTVASEVERDEETTTELSSRIAHKDSARARPAEQIRRPHSPPAYPILRSVAAAKLLWCLWDFIPRSGSTLWRRGFQQQDISSFFPSGVCGALRMAQSVFYLNWLSASFNLLKAPWHSRVHGVEDNGINLIPAVIRGRLGSQREEDFHGKGFVRYITMADHNGVYDAEGGNAPCFPSACKNLKHYSPQ